MDLVKHLVVIMLAALALPVLAANESKKAQSQTIRQSNPVLDFRMVVRTRAQMAAFYEGRGFSGKMIRALDHACFFTVIVKNKSRDIVWLEPAKWHMDLANGNKAKVLGQDYWRKRWQALDVKMSSRSTFGWTLLPDSRDLRPDEGVGGNLVLQESDQAFKFTPVFRLGAAGKTSLALDPITVHCGAR